jgi:hypothetical protein
MNAVAGESDVSAAGEVLSDQTRVVVNQIMVNGWEFIEAELLIYTMYFLGLPPLTGSLIHRSESRRSKSCYKRVAKLP